MTVEVPNTGCPPVFGTSWSGRTALRFRSFVFSDDGDSKIL
jgi:hypothetical protein